MRTRQDLAQQVFDHLVAHNMMTKSTLRTCFKDASLVDLDLSRVRHIDDNWAKSLTGLASAPPSPAPSVASSTSPSPLNRSRVNSGATDTSRVSGPEAPGCSSASSSLNAVDAEALASGLKGIADCHMQCVHPSDEAASRRTEKQAMAASEADGACDGPQRMAVPQDAQRHQHQQRETEEYYYGIERICLSNCRDVGEKTMQFIARAPTVTQLYLDGCVSIDDNCLQHIKGNHAITHLSLSGCINISSGGLDRTVVNFCGIRSLSLNSCWNVTELSFLENLRQLETLSLGWCYNVNDESVGVLRRLTRLRSLDVSKTNIGNRGIREIFEDSIEQAFCGIGRSTFATLPPIPHCHHKQEQQ